MRTGTLIETIPSGSVQDVGPSPFVTSSIWYTDDTRTKRIKDTTIVYNPNYTISQSVERVYASDGVTVLTTTTETMTYNGVFETTRKLTVT
jgi:hypothetical protein